MGMDIFFGSSHQPCPVVIYVHGFNGFKDWGNFDLIAECFAQAGLVLVKFNFSHNGTTPGNPGEFKDLESFGNNNYTKQLVDLRVITDWICGPLNPYHQLMDISKIYLMGHSMGAGIAVLQASEDERIKKLITWAGISECKTPWGNWPADKMEEWKNTGVQYYTNSRTQQQMPMYYQLYEDYLQNIERLDIQNAVKKINVPVLICHGTLDTAVPVYNAFELKKWQPAAQLFTVESDHVFGRKHPWTGNELPPATQAVIDKCLYFL